MHAFVSDGDDGRRTDARRGLSLRLAAWLGAVVIVAAVVYSAWSYVTEHDSMQDKALTEARTLCVEIMAAWEYIDDVQETINYDSDGTYDFKHVYCSIAGKSIAQRFTDSSEGYTIRFTRTDPRSGEDEPDEFEAAGLALFESGEAEEYYAVVEEDGTSTFRYMAVLTIGYGCLSCHGEPAGSLDEVGFIKEGMQLGDVAGAVSISIPLDAYTQSAKAQSIRTIVFFVALAVCLVVVAWAVLRRMVADPIEARNRELQAVSEAKSDMLATMSHELRTPLSSIIAYTDLWSKEREQGVQVDSEELVGEIKRSSEVLLEMVNNVIDSARVDAGKYEIAREQVDMDDLMADVNAMARPLARERGIDYSCTTMADMPIVLCDWEALRKIVSNLVGNALKYTDRGGSVQVRVGYDFDAGRLAVAVADTGVGIAADDLERIFERFSQTAEPTKDQKRNGSGLGLSLARELAELMGGTVDVESAPGEGSTFTVVVPAECIGEGDEED